MFYEPERTVIPESIFYAQETDSDFIREELEMEVESL